MAMGRVQRRLEDLDPVHHVPPLAVDHALVLGVGWQFHALVALARDTTELGVLKGVVLGQQ
eukprot:25254-Eustigmatos_ZCMA.PRE.1